MQKRRHPHIPFEAVYEGSRLKTLKCNLFLDRVPAPDQATPSRFPKSVELLGNYYSIVKQFEA